MPNRHPHRLGDEITENLIGGCDIGKVQFAGERLTGVFKNPTADNRILG